MAATCGIALAAPHVLDPTFDGDGKVATGFANGSADVVATQPDGRIVVAGRIIAGGSSPTSDIGVLRYNPNGSLDPTFDDDGAMHFSFGSGDDMDGVSDIAVEGGKIILVGSTTLTDGAKVKFAVARLEGDGDLDSSFGGDGAVTTEFLQSYPARASGVAVQDDGRIVVAGTAFPEEGAGAAGNFAVARYDTDGTLDDTFGGGDGKVMTGIGPCPTDTYGYDVDIQSDGKLVVAGNNENWRCDVPNDGPEVFNMAMARYNTDGTLDGDFGENGVVSTAFDRVNGEDAFAAAYDVKILPDDKIVLGGYADAFAVARYDADGTLDTSFDEDGRMSVLFGNQAEISGPHNFGEMVVTSGGRIVVAGTFLDGDTPGSDFMGALMRLNADGSLDERFSGDGKHLQALQDGEHFEARGLALQPDGKLLVAGQHKTYFFGLMRFKGGSEGPSGGLTMTSSSPVPNGSLKYTKDIVLGFSGPVDRDTVKPTTSASAPTPDATDYTVGLFLEKKDSRGHIYYSAVPAKFEYATSDPNKLIVDPKKRLYPKKRYVLMIQGKDSGLMDTDGATLVDDMPIFFKAKR